MFEDEGSGGVDEAPDDQEEDEIGLYSKTEVLEDLGGSGSALDDPGRGQGDEKIHGIVGLPLVLLLEMLYGVVLPFKMTIDVRLLSSLLYFSVSKYVFSMLEGVSSRRFSRFHDLPFNQAYAIWRVINKRAREAGGVHSSRWMG